MNHSTNCKHRPIYEIENKLYPDYDDGLYQRMYIEVKEEVKVEDAWLDKLDKYDK